MRSTIIFCAILLKCVCQSKPQFEESDAKQSESDNLSVNYYLTKGRITLKIICMNFNSLRYFNEASTNIGTLPTINAVKLEFVACFNNATNHENYRNFTLQTIFDWINPFLKKKTFQFEIELKPYGLVDSDVFYKNVNLNQLPKSLTIVKNVEFTNTKFLQTIIGRSNEMRLENVNHINFDDFRPNEIETTAFTNVSILNFTKPNLGKFPKIRFIYFYDVMFDTDNILNVPRLFDQNGLLTSLFMRGSAIRLILHDALFNGAHALESIFLINIKLEMVTKNLFSDLSKLVYLDLAENNIKILDSHSFINNKLHTLRLGHRELFSSGILQNLVLPQPDTTVEILFAHLSNYDEISALAQHPNMTTLIMQECDLANFDVSEFNKIHNRSTTIIINIHNTCLIEFSLAKFLNKNVNYKTCVPINTADVKTLNAILMLKLSRNLLEPKCTESTNIYLNDTNILIDLRDPLTDPFFRGH